MTKISILDCKTNMFVILFILGLYYEALNIYYPTKRRFRSDLYLFFKLIFIVSRGMKPTDHPFSGFSLKFFFFFFFSIIFDKQSISLLHRSFEYRNK